MPRLTAAVDPQSAHDAITWRVEENRALHAQLRRAVGDPMVVLAVYRQRLVCVNCFSAGVDGVLRSYRHPDVDSESWELDADGAWEAELVDLGSMCSECHRALRVGDEFYIEDEELPLDKYEVSAVEPSRATKKQVFQLYGHACFGCGASGVPLRVDHIQPRCRGGTAGFGNLQPLCEICDNRRKKDRPPTELVRFVP